MTWWGSIAIRVTHVPTGETLTCAEQRTMYRCKVLATRVVKARVATRLGALGDLYPQRLVRTWDLTEGTVTDALGTSPVTVLGEDDSHGKAPDVWEAVDRIEEHGHAWARMCGDGLELARR